MMPMADAATMRKQLRDGEVITCKQRSFMFSAGAT